jgi:hypothetical protein
MTEADLNTHLKANVASVNSRVYPMIMPQDCEKPALVYTVISDIDNQGLEGCVSSNNMRFQIDVYASSYLESKTIKNEVKAALYTFENYPMELTSLDVFEEEQGLYRQIIDFTLRSK